MKNNRRPVEIGADSVAGNAGHDAMAVLIREYFHSFADVRKTLAGATRLYALIHAPFRDGHQRFTARVRVSHAIRSRAISMDAAKVHGHVHRHQVTVPQGPVIRHSVAHDVVHGRADGL